jgi:hypothetical protein
MQESARDPPPLPNLEKAEPMPTCDAAPKSCFSRVASFSVATGCDSRKARFGTGSSATEKHATLELDHQMDSVEWHEHDHSTPSPSVIIIGFWARPYLICPAWMHQSCSRSLLLACCLLLNLDTPALVRNAHPALHRTGLLDAAWISGPDLMQDHGDRGDQDESP